MCFTRTIKHAALAPRLVAPATIGSGVRRIQKSPSSCAPPRQLCVVCTPPCVCTASSPANSILVRAWRFAAAPRIEPHVIGPAADWPPMMSSARRHWSTGGGNLSPSLSLSLVRRCSLALSLNSRGCYVHYIVCCVMERPARRSECVRMPITLHGRANTEPREREKEAISLAGLADGRPAASSAPSRQQWNWECDGGGGPHAILQSASNCRRRWDAGCLAAGLPLCVPADVHFWSRLHAALLLAAMRNWSVTQSGTFAWSGCSKAYLPVSRHLICARFEIMRLGFNARNWFCQTIRQF